jgi:ribosomal protein L13
MIVVEKDAQAVVFYHDHENRILERILTEAARALTTRHRAAIAPHMFF